MINRSYWWWCQCHWKTRANLSSQYFQAKEWESYSFFYFLLLTFITFLSLDATSLLILFPSSSWLLFLIDFDSWYSFASLLIVAKERRGWIFPPMLLLLWLYFTSFFIIGHNKNKSWLKTDTESTVIEWNLWEKNKKQKSLCNVNSLFFIHISHATLRSLLMPSSIDVDKERQKPLFVVNLRLYAFVCTTESVTCLMSWWCCSRVKKSDCLSIYLIFFFLSLLFTKFPAPSPVDVLNQAETFKGQFVLLTV